MKLVTLTGVAALSLAAAVAMSSLPSTLGCSSSSPTCAAYTPDEPFDTTTTASFKNDVYPIFVQSCGLSTSCHGAANGSNQGVYLGSKDGDSARAYQAIVNVKSDELTSMNYVTPGDTTNSYLMHKMDGDQCTLNGRCTGGDCESLMPQGTTEPLPTSTRDVVRRWILQGALDN